jgi:hypothetical protein
MQKQVCEVNTEQQIWGIIWGLFENSGVELPGSTCSRTEAKEEGSNLEKAFQELELDEEVKDSSGGSRERRKLKGSKKR